MAVNTLTAAVTALIDRIVVLEPLSIAEVTSGTAATKQYLYKSQTYPYWSNRITRLSETDRGARKWELGISAYLHIAHIDARTVDISGTNTPQELAWLYIPEVLTYFDAIKTTLAVGAYAGLSYLAPEGITVTCQNGMDHAFNQYTGIEALYIEFQISAPFMLLGV